MFKSGEDLIQYIENKYGILEFDFDTAKKQLTREQYALQQCKEYKEHFIEVYGSIEKAYKACLAALKDDNYLYNLIYYPLRLSWARNIAQDALGESWHYVEEIAVGTVTIPIFNAAACKSQDGQMAIIVNLPICYRLGEINEYLWMAMRKFLEKDVETAQQEKQKFCESVLSLRTRKDIAILFNISRRPRGRESALVSEEMADYQLLFILLHEYAHVILGHLGGTELYKSHPLDDIVKGVKFFTQSQSQEIEADKQALKWFFKLNEEILQKPELDHHDDIFTKFPIAISYLFTVLSELEVDSSSLDTHPPAIFRLLQLTHFCKLLTNDYSKLAYQNMKVFLGIYKELWEGKVPDYFPNICFKSE